MAKIVAITGQKACECYHILGREKGHVVRSNSVRFENGEQGIRCVFCGTALPTTVEALLTAAGQRTLPVQHDNPHQYEFQFNYGRRPGEFVYAKITFEDPEQFQLEPEEVGRPFDASEFSGLPEPLARIGRILSAVDYYVVAPRDLEEFHAHSLRTVTLVRGRTLVPGKPALDGVRVTLTYIV
jgi:hypothetical protein